MIYPYRSLPDNLAAFSALLRHEHRFRVGPRELQDAVRALEFVDLGNERAVRNSLRPVLTGSFDELRIFDQAFDRFFLGEAGGPAPREALAAFDETGRDRRSAVRRDDGDSQIREPGPREADFQAGEFEESDDAHGPVVRISDQPSDRFIGTLRTSYSPFQAEGEIVELAPADRAWRRASAVLVARVHRGLSRRWTPAPRGRRFDFRRALRGSLKTGGEVVRPLWRARPRRRPRFVVLIDGSRSMAPHADAALALAVAICGVTLNAETFTFSTALHRVTRDVRRAAAGERRRLHLHHAWGGGTTIGACLREFLRSFGDRLLTADTVVIVASDGLDVGEMAVLRDAMGRLSRRSAAVLWLNPLAETVGYEPTAAGMSVARPFITMLATVNDPEGLMRLARALRV